MADNELSIIVRTEAELAALQAYRKELEGLKGSVDASSFAGKSLQNSLDSVDKVIKQGVGASIPESAKGFELMGLKGHEAHMAMRLLTSQLGEFGHIAHFAMFSGWLAGLAAVAIAAKEVKQYFDEARQAVNDFNVANDKVRTDGIAAAAQCARDYRTALGEAADAVARMKTEYEQSNTAMGNATKLYNQQLDSVLAIAEAKRKTMDAEIEYDLKRGKISKEQADALKAAAGIQGEQQKGETEVAKKAREAKDLADQLYSAKIRLTQGGDKAAQDAAEAAVAGASTTADASAKAAKVMPVTVQGVGWKGQTTYGDVEELDKALKAKQTELADAQADLDKLRQQPNSVMGGAAIGGQELTVESLQKEADALNAATEAERTRLKLATDLKQQDEDALKHAKDIAAEAAARTKSDQEIVLKNPDKIRQLDSERHLEEKKNAATLQAARDTAAVQADTALVPDANAAAVARVKGLPEPNVINVAPQGARPVPGVFVPGNVPKLVEVDAAVKAGEKAAADAADAIAGTPQGAFKMAELQATLNKVVSVLGSLTQRFKDANPADVNLLEEEQTKMRLQLDSLQRQLYGTGI